MLKVEKIKISKKSAKILKKTENKPQKLKNYASNANFSYIFYLKNEKNNKKISKNQSKIQKKHLFFKKNAKISQKNTNFNKNTCVNGEKIAQNKAKIQKINKKNQNNSEKTEKNKNKSQKYIENSKKNNKKLENINRKIKNDDKNLEKNNKELENDNKNDEKIQQNKIENRKNLTKKIVRSVCVILAFCLLCVLGYYILIWTGAWEYINSVEKIRQLILSLGFWGRFAFVMIQFLQVTFLPIPSTISTLAGVLIYGPLQTALLSLAGILLGSVLAFWLGRFFGRKLVVFMVGKQSCQKWTKFLTDAKYSFVVMMLLPMFPDDILCLVAGLTDMSWEFFVVTNLISRPIGVFLTCYLGSGSIIPYHGWGLIVWGVILVLVAMALYASFKYRAQIENFLQKTFSKKDR